MGLSAYLRGVILEASVGLNPTLSLPSTLHLALLTQLPVDVDTGSTIVELTYPEYDRIAVAGSSWEPGQADGSITNHTAIPLTPPSSGEYRAIAFALCDAATEGRVHWFGQMPAILLSASDPAPQIDAHAILLTAS